MVSSIPCYSKSDSLDSTASEDLPKGALAKTAENERADDQEQSQFLFCGRHGLTVMLDDKMIEARFTAADLKVADLTSAEWNKASPLQINRYWSGAPASLERQAEVRILWSEKALHLRFICHQGEPLVVSDMPQTEKKTMGLWDRDVCEIFIAPDPNVVERYFEFEAAPTGEWLDVAIHWSPKKRESDWEFRSGMSCAAMKTITKGGAGNDLELVWIGMRIPWNHWIHEPQKGERWRVNLFRCVGKDPNRGYLAWQPTKTPQPNFHLPKVFGWLLFK